METCNVCIKGVNRVDWLSLKADAARCGKTIAEHLSALSNLSREKPKSNLDAILSKVPILTEEEANDILEASREFRKDFDFR